MTKFNKLEADANDATKELRAAVGAAVIAADFDDAKNAYDAAITAACNASLERLRGLENDRT